MTSINKLSFKEFEPTKITVTEIQEPKKIGNKEPTQLTAFVNYNGGRLELQTPWIPLEQGGVPRLDDYNPTEKKRCCIKLPLNIALNNEIATFYNKFLEVDKIIGSEESKTKLFGKKAGKYKYLNSVKLQDADEDEGPSTKLPKLNCRFAAVFDKDNKDAVTSITTKVFVTTLKEDGKVLSREEQSPANINELANIVRFRSKVRLIIQPARLWASKTPAAGADKMTYGVIWQVKGIEVQPSLGGTSTNTNADFIDDSDDDTPQAKPTGQSITQTLLTNLTKKSTNHSDDDEEEEEEKPKIKDSDDEDEEEEAEPVPPPKKSKSKTPTDKKKTK